MESETNPYKGWNALTHIGIKMQKLTGFLYFWG